MALGLNKYGKESVYHYIPLHQTLQTLMKDESVYLCLHSVCTSQNGELSDLHHGEVYGNVSVTCKNSSFIGIILYQDAFELVNPLGSAKKVHKVVGVYFRLANLPSYARTTIDNIQLVLLGREDDLNHFGANKVFQNCVSEINELEANGLYVNGKVYDVRLLFILGDNLGSHWLGGFTTNFSNNSFICRYCLVQKKKMTVAVCVLQQSCVLLKTINKPSALLVTMMTMSCPYKAF